MKAFERSPAYKTKITLDALDGEVHLDAHLRCVFDRRKYRVWYMDKSCFVKFPNALRGHRKEFIADVIKCRRKNTNAVFYQAYKGSIRDLEGNVVG